MNELFQLFTKIPEAAAKLITQGTKETVNISFTFMGRRLGADITLHLLDASGQKGNQPATPPQPQPSSP